MPWPGLSTCLSQDTLPSDNTNVVKKTITKKLKLVKPKAGKESKENEVSDIVCDYCDKNFIVSSF